MKPTRGILDPAFKYVPSVETNIRLTFMRERRRIAKEKAIAEEQRAKVTELKRGKA